MIKGIRSAAVGAIGIFVVMMLATVWANTPYPTAGNASMGGEYGNIAESIVSGEGFANPFGIPSGPTAWMPPLLPYFIAGVFGVFGVKTYAAMWALLAANCLAIAGGWGLFFGAFRGYLSERGRLGLQAMLTLFLGSQAYLLVTGLTDFSWVFFLSGLLTYLVARTLREGWGKTQWLWVVAGLVIPLSSANLTVCLAAALAVVFGVEYRRNKETRGGGMGEVLRTHGRPIATVMMVVFLALGVWGGRNYMALGKVIPLKSNLWYEAYLAQNVSSNGVLNNGIFLVHHPFSPGEVQDAFASKGEIAFVGHFGGMGKEAIAGDFLEYLRRVMNRCANAFIYTRAGHGAVAMGPEVSVADGERLKAEGLAGYVRENGRYVWLAVDWEPSVLRKRLGEIGLENADAAYRDWNKATGIWREREYAPWAVVSGITMAALPTLAIMGILLRRRLFGIAGAVALLYLLYLAPYLVVSHYFRYQVPLFGWQAVLCFFALAPQSWISRKELKDTENEEQPSTNSLGIKKWIQAVQSDHRLTEKRLRWVAVGLCAIPLMLHLMWYAGTPMGREPVMDGYYNLEMAKEMAAGELPERAFFRAPLYSAVLAVGYAAGVPEALMPDLARLINVVAYVAMLVFVGMLAQAVWKNKWAGVVGVLAVGLHPVPHFFAGDPYDITITSALLAAFAWVGWRVVSNEQRQPGLVAVASLLIGAGCALRSQLLPLALLWPLIAGGLCFWREKKMAAALAVVGLAAIGPALSFVGLGVAHWKIAGEFRVMPWQGPYMIYYGNNPELFTGYIYTQKVYVETDTLFPVEAEALELFERQTGRTPPYSIDEVNAHYTGEVKRIVLEDPVAWAALPLRKAYGLLNNVEQYDNKTWELQKGISPILRWNPLNWGLLLLLGVAGGWALWGNNRKALLWIGLVAGLYIVVSLVTIVNNRYRLPLYPLLGVLAGGAPLLWGYFRGTTCQMRYVGVGLILVVGFATFPRFFGVEGADTRLADYVLMAQAANKTGADAEALQWAKKAYELDNVRPDIKELWLTSSYNLVFSGERIISGAELNAELRKGMELLADERQRQKDTVRHICGVWAWKLGNTELAARLWAENVQGNKSASMASNDSMGALLLTGMLSDPEVAFALENEPKSALLDFSRANYRKAFTQEQRALGPFVKGLFERAAE